VAGPTLEVRPLDEGVAFVGTLDLSTGDAAGEALDRLAVPGASFTVDLVGLTFMDSTGLNLLVRALEAVGDEGRLTIRVGPGIVAKVLGVSGLPERPNVVIETA
jgi:anti-anti-sigma factor